MEDCIAILPNKLNELNLNNSVHLDDQEEVEKMIRKNRIKEYISKDRENLDENGRPRLDERDKVHIDKIVDYFLNNDSKFQMFLDIINDSMSVSGSKLSLRCIDHFLTIYVNPKKSGGNPEIKYQLMDGDRLKEFNVYKEYQSNLCTYKKGYFDPFCRLNKFHFNFIPKGTSQVITVNTTIAQLNFFVWALKYGVVEYIQKNLSTIRAHMSMINTKKNTLKKAMMKPPSNGVSTKKKKKIRSGSIGGRESSIIGSNT